MDWLKRMGRGVERSSEQLVEEASAYLEGRYLEVALGLEQTPAWVQLNWITHAPAQRLLAQALWSKRPNRPAGSWEWAIVAVLDELTVLSDADPNVVRALQWDCLLPVELALMAPGCWNVSPMDVASLAVARMRAHPLVFLEDETGPEHGIIDDCRHSDAQGDNDE